MGQRDRGKNTGLRARPDTLASRFEGDVKELHLFICIHAKLLHCFPILCDPLNYSPPGCSVHGILEWVFMPSSRESSWPRDRTRILHLLHQQVGSLPLAPPGKPPPVYTLTAKGTPVSPTRTQHAQETREREHSCTSQMPQIHPGQWWTQVWLLVTPPGPEVRSAGESLLCCNKLCDLRCVTKFLTSLPQRKRARLSRVISPWQPEPFIIFNHFLYLLPQFPQV